MSTNMKLCVTAALLLLLLWTVFASRVNIVQTSEEMDRKVVETMNELREERDENLAPIKQLIDDQQSSYDSLQKKYNTKIDSFKELLSYKYISTVEELCNVNDPECDNLKKNIIFSAPKIIPSAKADGVNTSTHNLGDYKKLDKWFKSKHSPLNGYGFSFTTYAKQYNIDADFGVCITWADSQSGKMLTTPNNWGNVGNNDRGHRQGYKTPQEGIEAIFKLLNNQYQKNNNIIGHFSNGGRKKLGLPESGAKGTFVYATSPFNWNNNVLKCMNELKDHQVDENYFVRNNKQL